MPETARSDRRGLIFEPIGELQAWRSRMPQSPITNQLKNHAPGVGRCRVAQLADALRSWRWPLWNLKELKIS